MIIRKMTAHFGALDGKTLGLAPGLNVLYAPNESGKSTWCAFLRAMLYGVGMPQRARAGQKPDKVKYLPWSGAPMSGSMELETKDGPVTLRRWTERAGQPMQAFSATVTGTDTPVKGMTADSAGELLTGVPREVFERSVFVRQAGVAMTNEPELDRRLAALASSGDEEVSFIEAEARLKAWQRRRRSGKRGAIPELEARIGAAEASLEALRRESETVAAAERDMEALRTACDEAVVRMQRARAEQRRNTLREIAARRERAEQARAVLGDAEAKLDAAREALTRSPFSGLPAGEASDRAEADRNAAAARLRAAERTPSGALALIPLALAAAALALAFFLPWRTACLGAAGFFVLLLAVTLLRLRALRSRRADLLADRQRILDVYGVSEPAEIDGRLAEYRRLLTAEETARRDRDEAAEALDRELEARKEAETRLLDGLDFSRGDGEAAQAGREVERLRGELAAVRERRAAAEGRAMALGDRAALESELDEARRRLAGLREQEKAIALALETLTEADAELQQRFSPLLAEKAASYFAFLTDGRYDELTLSRELAAKARPAGQDVGRETDYLSGGAKDQLYLALRLAVCDLALGREDPCPMVLDDALVNFDRDRMERALRLIRGLAETRQILLFSCHEREYEFFASDPDVTRIILE